MPQMAPISWLILFFIFSIAFMLFNVVNYYCFYYNNNNSNNNASNSSIDQNNVNKMNWKW